MEKGAELKTASGEGTADKSEDKLESTSEKVETTSEYTGKEEEKKEEKKAEPIDIQKAIKDEVAKIESKWQSLFDKRMSEAQKQVQQLERQVEEEKAKAEEAKTLEELGDTPEARRQIERERKIRGKEREQRERDFQSKQKETEQLSIQKKLDANDLATEFKIDKDKLLDPEITGYWQMRSKALEMALQSAKEAEEENKKKPVKVTSGQVTKGGEPTEETRLKERYPSMYK